jgi:hypothetical protein
VSWAQCKIKQLLERSADVACGGKKCDADAEYADAEDADAEV